MANQADHRRLVELCQAVGYVTLVWAQIDLTLDFCNVNLRNLCGPHPKWPRVPGKGRLDQKFKFARAHLAGAPLPDAAKAEGRQILGDLDMLSDERHWLIHGAATYMDEGSAIRLARTHLQIEPTPMIEERSVDLNDITLFGDASMQLCNRLGQFVLTELTIRVRD